MLWGPLRKTQAKIFIQYHGLFGLLGLEVVQKLTSLMVKGP